MDPEIATCWMAATTVPTTVGAVGVARLNTGMPTPGIGMTASDPDTATSSPSKEGFVPPIATGALGVDTSTVAIPNAVDATKAFVPLTATSLAIPTAGM